MERKLIADTIATGPTDATRVRDDELAGYGSSATWAENQEPEPAAIPHRPRLGRSEPPSDCWPCR